MTWTHRICERCWFDGPGRIEDTTRIAKMPVQVRNQPPGKCCYCGGLTITGIFARKNPADLQCRGEHDDDDDD